MSIIIKCNYNNNYHFPRVVSLRNISLCQENRPTMCFSLNILLENLRFTFKRSDEFKDNPKILVILS